MTDAEFVLAMHERVEASGLTVMLEYEELHCLRRLSPCPHSYSFDAAVDMCERKYGYSMRLSEARRLVADAKQTVVDQITAKLEAV